VRRATVVLASTVDLVALFIGVAVVGGTAMGALVLKLERFGRDPLSAPIDPAQRERLEAWARPRGWDVAAGDDLAIADTAAFLRDLVGPPDGDAGFDRRHLRIGAVVRSPDRHHVVFEARRDADAFVFAAMRRDSGTAWVTIDVDARGTRTTGPGLREGVGAGLLADLGSPARLRVGGGWIALGAAGRLEPALADRALHCVGEVARALTGSLARL
jgi:hypothetical protein